MLADNAAEGAAEIQRPKVSCFLSFPCLFHELINWHVPLLPQRTQKSGDADAADDDDEDSSDDGSDIPEDELSSDQDDEHADEDDCSEDGDDGDDTDGYDS